MTSCPASSVGRAAVRFTKGTNNFLPNVTLLVSEVIRIIYLKHQHETPQTC